MFENITRRFKKVPETNETKEVGVAQLWYVRWERRYGQFSGQTEDMVEAFLVEQDAKDFKTSLKQANKLIGNTSGTDVYIEKAK